MKRAILVHNPTAGSGQHSRDELEGLLRAVGYSVRHVHAKMKEEMNTLADARGLIVVAGGDGTVHKVAKRVAGLGKTLALLPLGTANNIARSLGVEAGPREIIAGLGRARRVTIDAGVAKGPWGKRIFLEGMGGGLFAEVMARLDSGRRRPRKRSSNGENHITRFSRRGGALEPALHAFLEMVPDFKAAASQVSIDNNHISGRFLLFEALNMPYLGPNLHLAPDADPSDGMLDFVLLGEGQREEFQGYLKHRLDGGHDAPILTVIKGRRLRFVWRGSKLHVDDKIVPNGHRNSRKGRKAIEIYIKPGAMDFLLPRLKGAPRHRPKKGAGRRANRRR